MIPSANRGRGDSIVILVDGERFFADGRRCRTARTAEDAVALLRQFEFGTIDELWLDSDGGWLPDAVPTTLQPVVDELLEGARTGRPYPVAEVRIHGRNSRGAARLKAELEGAGYRVVRDYNLRVLTRTPAGAYQH